MEKSLNTKAQLMPKAERERKYIANLERNVVDIRKTVDMLRVSGHHLRKNCGINDLILEWDVLTGENYTSPRWNELMGFSEKELDCSSSTFFTRVHCDDLQRVNDVVMESIFEGVCYDTDLRLRTKNNNYLWFHFRGHADADEHGKISIKSCSVRDIAEFNLAEAALRESEERYRSFFACMDSIRLIIDPSTGAIKDANPAAVKFYGYDLNQLLGMFLHDLNTLPEDTLFAVLAKATKEESGHYFFRHRLACGEVRDVEIYTSAIQFQGDNFLMSSIHDITELRRLEKIKDDVARIVRHDLKSPLNGIINIPLLLLQDANLTNDQQEMLNMVAVTGRKMLDQIDSSLKLCKIESGNYCIQPQVFDPVQLVRDNVKLLSAGFCFSPELIHIREDGLNGDGGIVTIKTERSLLDTILMNLLRNAVEANNDEKVIVDFSKNGKEFSISICNDHPVPMEIRDRFFEKYSTYGKNNGTGLGTYSAAMMAKALGGKIEMETSDERGTKVTVRIPNTA